MDIAVETPYIRLGEFEYQSNPWNKGELVYGEDFTQYIAKSPVGECLRIGWEWPETLTGVTSYPSIIWGLKPWSTTSTTPILPARITELEDFDVDFKLAWAPEPRGNFNVAFDLWLASAPQDGPSTKVTEVMVWVKNWDWTPSETPVASYMDANGSGKIYHRANHVVSQDSWNYAAILYDKDVTEGVLDLSVLLDQLVQLDILSKDDYLLDVELGAEIVNGFGWFDLHKFSVSTGGLSTDLVTNENLLKLP